MPTPVAEINSIEALEAEQKQLEQEIALEMAKAAADVAGIVDPTPTSDGISAAISLKQGEYLDAALSGLSFIPLLGDAIAKPIKGLKGSAKMLKLRKKAAVIKKQIDAVKKSLQKTEKAKSVNKKTSTKKNKNPTNSKTNCPISDKVIKKHNKEKKRIREWLKNPANLRLWKERKELAAKFYRDQGWTDEKAINRHIKGIDFSKHIEVKTIPEPYEIWQYKKFKVDDNGEIIFQVDKNGKRSPVFKEGSYYTMDKNAKPSELGISEEYVIRDKDGNITGGPFQQELHSVDLNNHPPGSIKTLSSSARSVNDFWNPAEAVPTKGGANQLFINSLRL